MHRPGERRPRANAGACAGPLQVDGGAAAPLVRAGVGREVALVGAPAELGRLHAFGDEPVDRPRVDELVGLLAPLRHLVVALGDVDHAHADPLRQPRPAFACLRRLGALAGQFQQRLLDEPRHEARVRAQRDAGRGLRLGGAAQRQRSLAQRVVRAFSGRPRAVRIAAGPWLGAGVDVERSALLAQGHERLAAHIDGQVEEKVAGPEPGLEHLAVVVPIELRGRAPNSPLMQALGAALGRREHFDLARLHIDVAQQQRQDTLPHAAETKDDDAAVERRFPAFRGHALQKQARCLFSGHRGAVLASFIEHHCIFRQPCRSTPSRCAHSASSPRNAATWTCASRPHPARAKASPGTRWWPRRRGAAYRAEVAARRRARASSWCAAAPTATTRNGASSRRSRPIAGELDAPAGEPRALHWAQARVYGWLLCRAQALSDIELALVYFDVDTQRRNGVRRALAGGGAAGATSSSAAMRSSAWARQELAHRSARDAALASMAFPHSHFRAGQRRLAEAVFRAARARALPDGAGAHRHRQDDRHAVPDAEGRARAGPGQASSSSPPRPPAVRSRWRRCGRCAAVRKRGPLRVLELVARDKACEHPDKACHGDSCPLARGFYDRLPAAREAALALPAWDTRRGARPRPDARHLPLLPDPGTGALEPTWWWATTTTSSTAARCCTAWPRRTTGAWACWSTRRTTWWRGRARCTARRSTARPHERSSAPPRRR